MIRRAFTTGAAGPVLFLGAIAGLAVAVAGTVFTGKEFTRGSHWWGLVGVVFALVVWLVGPRLNAWPEPSGPPSAPGFWEAPHRPYGLPVQ